MRVNYTINLVTNGGLHLDSWALVYDTTFCMPGYPFEVLVDGFTFVVDPQSMEVLDDGSMVVSYVQPPTTTDDGMGLQ